VTRAEIKSFEALVAGPPLSEYQPGTVDAFEIVEAPPTKIAQPAVRHRRAPRRGHVGAPCRRPAGRRATTSARGGDSGDSDSGDPEPGPGSGRQLTSTDARRALVERMAALDALTAGWSE
jgi:hypothetical protein